MKVLKPLRNRRVTLHVGLPKTATSSLQATLAQNYAQCMDAGFCYPQAMRTQKGYRNHLLLNNAATGLSDRAFIDEYQSVLTEAGDRDIFFSYEGFSRQLIRGQTPVVTMLNQIHGAENVQILITLRNVYAFADSLVAQFYKGSLFGIDPNALARSGKLTPQGFFAASENAFGFPIYSYMRYIHALEARLPENEIRLISIEKDDLNEPYLDFMARYLGLEGGFENLPEKNVNARGANQLMMCLREARRHLRIQEFNECRPLIRSYCEAQSVPGLDARNRYLHIDDVLRAEICRVAEAEKTQFLPLIDTPGDALFENKPVPPTEDAVLPRAMKKEIKRICRKHVRPQGLKGVLSDVSGMFRR